MRIEVQGLFAVKERLFVFALLDIGHGPVGEHALVFLKFNSFSVETDGLINFTCLKCLISGTLFLFSLCG